MKRQALARRERELLTPKIKPLPGPTYYKVRNSVTSCTLALSPVNSHIGVLSLGKASRFNFSMECSESFMVADSGDGC
jgi:hypothetical protein